MNSAAGFQPALPLGPFRGQATTVVSSTVRGRQRLADRVWGMGHIHRRPRGRERRSGRRGRPRLSLDFGSIAQWRACYRLGVWGPCFGPLPATTGLCPRRSPMTAPGSRSGQHTEVTARLPSTPRRRSPADAPESAVQQVRKSTCSPMLRELGRGSHTHRYRRPNLTSGPDKDNNLNFPPHRQRKKVFWLSWLFVHIFYMERPCSDS